MTPARLLFVLGLGIAASRSGFAQDTDGWIGAPDCRLAPVQPAPAQAPAWSGGCKDGYASGKGVLEWRDKDGKTARLEATFLAGQIQGEATLHAANGDVYTGTFRGGIADGQGYVRYRDGAQYEGGMRMGMRSGNGEMLYANGNDYSGQWKDNEPDGFGTKTYMLGGRYVGGWTRGKQSGQGKLVYAGIPGREVATLDGRDPGRPDTPAPTRTYTLKDDHAHVGTLLREDIALGSTVPTDRGYQDLSTEQRAIVNSWYPALAPGDEPPYPRHGPAEFYKFMSLVTGRMRLHGDIFIVVTVGANGKPTGVRAVGLDDAEMRKLIATAAAAVEYKPARCAGQPCEMAYGYRLALGFD